MLLNPRLGQEVMVWYRQSVRDQMPLHGKVGTADVVSRGKPRNHGIGIDGTLYVVPCGNLVSPKTA